MSKLYFRYGAMGSSKTANALMVAYNYKERGQKALLVKPKLDNRDGERIIASRAGLSEPCVFMEELHDFFNSSTYIPGSIACVIVSARKMIQPMTARKKVKAIWKASLMLGR